MSEEERNARLHTQEMTQDPEPYILSGYENLPNINGVIAPSEYAPHVEPERPKEYNLAHDPVYSSREWWVHMTASQPMEHQYGMLEQMRSQGCGGVSFDNDEEML